MFSSGSSTCRPLPAELWGVVCSFVGDLELWITCRQVSRTLRKEAEREFGSARLPKLQLIWDLRSNGWHEDVEYFFTSRIKLQQGAAQPPQLNHDGSRVHLQLELKMVYFAPNSGGLVSPTPTGISTARGLAKEATWRSFQDANGGPVPGSQSAVSNTPISMIGNYTNDTPLPALAVNADASECSFDWKSFLDAFYGQYVHVGKQLRPQNPVLAILDKFEQASADITNHYLGFDPVSTLQTRYLCSFNHLEDGLFQRAYIARLKRAHERGGLKFTLSIQDMNHVQSRVGYLRRVRYFRMAYHLSAERGIETSWTLRAEAGYEEETSQPSPFWI